MIDATQLTDHEKARFSRMIALAVHALAIVNAATASDAQGARRMAVEMLDTHCPQLYPACPAQGIADMQHLARELGLKLEIVEMPFVAPSPYGDN